MKDRRIIIHDDPQDNKPISKKKMDKIYDTWIKSLINPKKRAGCDPSK